MSEVRIEYVPIRKLRPAPRNPRGHDLERIRQSIRAHGFVAPIILDDKSGRVVAGHGRIAALAAMKKDGEEPPERILVENGSWLAPVLRGVSFRNPKQAEAYLLADNRLVETGDWDSAILAEMLQDLESADLLEATGFDSGDLGELLAGLADPNFSPTDGSDQPRLDQREPVECPKCGHRFVPWDYTYGRKPSTSS